MSNELQSKEEKLKGFLDAVLEMFEDDLSVCLSSEDDHITVEIKGDDTSVFTDNDGKVLDAVRILASSVVNDRDSGYTKISVDAGDFRKKKNDRIAALALKAADEVKAEGEARSLPDMNSYDRRIAHVALQDDPLIRTESEGEDPHRHLVIYPA